MIGQIGALMTRYVPVVLGVTFGYFLGNMVPQKENAETSKSNESQKKQ